MHEMGNFQGYVKHHNTFSMMKIVFLKSGGQPRWRSGLALPAARGVILETQDGVPHRAPCMEPASPSASLSMSLINK